MSNPESTLNLTVGDLSPSTINRHLTAAQRIDLRMAPHPDSDGSSVVWIALIGLAQIGRASCRERVSSPV